MRILFSEYQEKRSEREKKRAKRVATPNGGEKLQRKFTVNEKNERCQRYFLNMGFRKCNANIENKYPWHAAVSIESIFHLITEEKYWVNPLPLGKH